ncbi:hypothetical protein K438DRAFT_938411 [Mycena galopus ATCC 62051]|nr:hypothetical protein K438DRAFT_938411 [Mycena galopus ATCC 62051]
MGPRDACIVGARSLSFVVKVGRRNGHGYVTWNWFNTVLAERQILNVGADPRWYSPLMITAPSNVSHSVAHLPQALICLSKKEASTARKRPQDERERTKSCENLAEICFVPNGEPPPTSRTSRNSRLCLRGAAGSCPLLQDAAELWQMSIEPGSLPTSAPI